MHTSLRTASGILVVSAIAIALVSTPSPSPPQSTAIDYSGRNVYTLDWTAIYPGNVMYSGTIVVGFVSVHSLADVLRWAGSMPKDTILLCSRYQAEDAKPASIRVFAPGQFEFFRRVCRDRGIRVIVKEDIPPSTR